MYMSVGYLHIYVSLSLQYMYIYVYLLLMHQCQKRSLLSEGIHFQPVVQQQLSQQAKGIEYEESRRLPQHAVASLLLLLLLVGQKAACWSGAERSEGD